jgi:hypothetical protein
LGEQYRSLSSSLCSFLHSPFTSSVLGPSIQLWINYRRFSNKTLSNKHKKFHITNHVDKIQLACTWLSASQNGSSGHRRAPHYYFVCPYIAYLEIFVVQMHNCMCEHFVYRHALTSSLNCYVLKFM